MDIICENAEPQTDTSAFKKVLRSKPLQSKKWGCCRFHIGTLFSKQKFFLNLIFVPILQSVYMQASDQLCKEHKQKIRKANKTLTKAGKENLTKNSVFFLGGGGRREREHHCFGCTRGFKYLC